MIRHAPPMAHGENRLPHLHKPELMNLAAGARGGDGAELAVTSSSSTALASGGPKSRFGAALELLGNEATHGITGKDMVGDTVQAAINGLRVIVQAGLEAVPSAVHAVTGQKFYVTPREGVIDATEGAVKSVITEIRNGKFISAIYTAAAEFIPDAPTRDILQTDSIIVAADQ